MAVLNKLKHLIKVSDFFYSTEMLRYDREMEYKTLTGGIISIGIIITIVVGFASMILQTLDLSSITTATEVIKNSVPPAATIQINSDSMFRFAVQIYSVNLSDTKRYFDVTFNAQYQSYGTGNTTIQMPLQTCTPQFFSNYPQISDNFDILNSGYWLCPTLNTTLNLYGKYSSAQYNQYTIQVSACTNGTSQIPCASFQQIQTFFNAYQDFLYFTIYYTNPQINPDKKNYKQYYFEDESYVIFGRNVGSETYLYFSDYTVTTDYSIWPFSDNVDDTGCLVENLAINHPFETNVNGTYITFNLAKSANSIIYQRQVQKLSTVFAFMGGMIGSASAVLFFIKVYTSLSFEFSISLEIFKNDKEGKTQQQKEEERVSMNFWNFIKYYTYVFLRLIGKPLDWPTIKYADECKQQILRQLDIKIILKRIIFIQHCLTHMIEDYQLDALQLSKPTSPGAIRAIRKKCQSVIDKSIEASELEQKPQTEWKESEWPHGNNIGSPTIIQFRKNTIIKKHYPDIHSHEKQHSKQLNQKIDFEKNHDLIIDIESMKSEIQSDLGKSGHDFVRKIPRKRQKLPINHEREARRSNFLGDLIKNVREGNRVSRRIFDCLDPSIRKAIQHQNLEHFQ